MVIAGQICCAGTPINNYNQQYCHRDRKFSYSTRHVIENIFPIRIISLEKNGVINENIDIFEPTGLDLLFKVDLTFFGSSWMHTIYVHPELDGVYRCHNNFMTYISQENWVKIKDKIIKTFNIEDRVVKGPTQDLIEL